MRSADDVIAFEGQFDPADAQPWGHYGLDHVDTAANRALAEDAALQGFVLLKNERATLPFKAGKGSLAVLGPHANAISAMLGNYHEKVEPKGVMVTPCKGIAAANVQPATTAAGSSASPTESGANVTTVCSVPDGCTVAGNATCFDGATGAAVAAASAVVLVIGIDGSQEAEGHDRTEITLPGTQEALVAAAAKSANGKPVVVVVLSGSAVDLSSLKDDDRIGAIVWVGRN